ncbi:MAG TPA: RHS repeat-associated core domain-containing protein [Candidatus Nanoarchaeia archaeon]|nr:RHS repeat-associated core domain-containing protein [Candidatus Nanoarchaeia archaeon]
MNKALMVMVVIAWCISLVPIDAALYMNDVLIPEGGGVPDYLRQLAGSFGEKQVSSTVYIYANGQRIAKQQDGKTFYFHNDHLGSATVVTDEDGKVVEEKKYDPFGVELAGSSKIGYNSKELDKDTELNYYGARYYGSEFGRFTTADTVKGKLTNPQSLNLYAYTLNNPLKYVDPSGNRVIILGSRSEIKSIFSAIQNLAGQYLETRRHDVSNVIEDTPKEFKRIMRAQLQFESGKSVLESFKTEGEIRLEDAFDEAVEVNLPNIEMKSKNPGTFDLLNRIVSSNYLIFVRHGKGASTNRFTDFPESVGSVQLRFDINTEFRTEIIVAHELLGHGLETAEGRKTKFGYGVDSDIFEENAVNIENQAAKELDTPIVRESYKDWGNWKSYGAGWSATQISGRE